jgi:murein DD-endopeptidase MepM/ murein hydrolase activator NlpD
MTVGSNDSLTAISQRYGVPANAILTANAFGNASEIQPGREIVIPVFNANGQAVAAAAPAPVRAAAPAPAPVRTAAAAPAPAKEKLVFVVGPKPAGQKTAQASDKAETAAKTEKTEKTRVRPGMVAAAKPAPAPAPVVQSAAAKPAPAPAPKPAPVVVAQKPAEPARPAPQPVVVAQKPVEPAKPAAQPEPVKVAKVEPAPAKPAAPAAAQAYAPQPEPAKDVVATASLPSGPATDFRWPARGRVIAGFGANGGNEGINIAVPEGTPVKATDDGTVTYVGGDVKAYGNLVLIKHDNGFVSAYAHNGELVVKRGERVRRGQVVAKSGQSGNVTSPQLHFELRKGQAAVDPVPHLNGG